MKKKLSKAEEIYAEFSTRKHSYRRESLIDGDKEKIIALFDDAIINNTKIELLMLWGQGERNTVAAPEKMALEFLSKAINSISERHEEGVNINVVFTDSHIKFNGFTVSENYRDEVSKLFDETFKHTNISHTMQNMTDIVTYTPTADGESFKEYAQFKENAPSVQLEDKLMRELTFAAQKHFHSDPEMTPEDAAKAYYLMNKHENPEMAEKFPDNIFLTNNNKRSVFVTPKGLPTFFMNSLNKNTSVKPWFTDERIVDNAKVTQAPEIVTSTTKDNSKERL